MAHRFLFVDFPRAETDEAIEFDSKWMQYLVYQKEKCPQTGKFHYQGFVYTKKKSRQTTVLKKLGGRLTVQTCRGTADQNIAYCTKEESRVAGKMTDP